MTIGKLSNAVKKVKKNILPPFEDSRWTTFREPISVVKNGYEVVFSTTLQYAGLNYNVPLMYAGKTLSFSVSKAKGSASTRVHLGWRIGSTWYENAHQILGSGKKDNINIPVNVDEIRFSVQNYTTSVNNNLYFKDIQLEEGYSSTEFEELMFKSGKVSKGLVPKRNLIDENYVTLYNQTSVKIQNGYFVADNGYYGGYEFYADIKKGKDYILSFIANTLDNTGWYDFSDTKVGGSIFSSNKTLSLVQNGLDQKKEIAFTSNVDTKLKIRLIRSGEAIGVGTVKYKSIQLEEGSVSTEYEPFKLVNPKTGRGSLSFNGSMRSFARTGTIPIADKYTLAVKFKPRSAGQIMWGTGTNRNIINLQSDLKLAWYSEIGGVGRGYHVYGNVTFGREHTAVFRYDGTKVELILDGVKLYEYQATGLSSGGSINLGTNYINSGNFLDGEMYFFKYFKRALSDSEVSSVEEFTDSSILVDYDYTKPQDRKVMNDFSGNLNHGVLYGAKSRVKSPVVTTPRAPMRNNKFTFVRQSTETLGNFIYRYNQPRFNKDGGILLEEGSKNLLRNNIRGHGSSLTLTPMMYEGRPVYRNVVTSPSTGNNFGVSMMNGNVAVPNGVSKKFTLTAYHKFIKYSHTSLVGLGGYVRVKYSDATTDTFTIDPRLSTIIDGKWKEVRYQFTTSAIKTVTHIESAYIYIDGAIEGDMLITDWKLEDTYELSYSKNIRPMEKLDIPMTLDGQGGSIEVDFDFIKIATSQYVFDSTGSRWLMYFYAGNIDVFLNGSQRMSVSVPDIVAGRHKVTVKWTVTTCELLINGVSRGTGIHNGASSATKITLGRRFSDVEFLNGTFYDFVIKDRNGLTTFKL